MCEKEGCVSVCLCVEGVLEGKLCERECAVRGKSLWE